MGYGERQTAELEQTSNDTSCDLVVIGTAIDLRRLIDISKPSVRVRYELQSISRPTLEEMLGSERWGCREVAIASRTEPVGGETGLAAFPGFRLGRASHQH